MRAMTIHQFGGPEVLTLADVPDPELAPDHVVIDVAATAVNRADILQRQGFYPPPPGIPDWPGLECSGRISAIGAGVTQWRIGDEVCALLSGGGYAEKVSVPAGQVLPVPEGISLIDAAALPEVVCTVWSNVFMTAQLQPHETFLVHGGSSGIGTMAIQLAQHFGATVACTAGTDEKLEFCSELGAEILINYRNDDFVRALKNATDGIGAHVILDNMGASYLGRNVDALAIHGRLVIIGMQGGVKAELAIGQLLLKRAAVHATSLRARTTEEKAAIVSDVQEKIWPLLDSGAIKPVVDSYFDLDQAQAAHQHVESSHHRGKVVLRIGS